MLVSMAGLVGAADLKSDKQSEKSSESEAAYIAAVKQCAEREPKKSHAPKTQHGEMLPGSD